MSDLRYRTGAGMLRFTHRRSTTTILADRRLMRAAVVTFVIAGYMAVGFALQLSANAYLLLGIPITVGFQLLVARRPLRALWLRQGPPFAFGRRSVAAVFGLSIAPAFLAINGAQAGDLVLVAYGLAAMAGAAGTVYALRAMDREALGSTVRTTLIYAAILVAIVAASRLATGGFTGNPGGAVVASLVAVATYLPVVFVMEEVLFRGAIDAYLHRSVSGLDRASALYGSALWGLWHLPVAAIGLGLLTIPYVVVVHGALGYILVMAWRRTGNLAVPGIAHAVGDALRNAVLVL